MPNDKHAVSTDWTKFSHFDQRRLDDLLAKLAYANPAILEKSAARERCIVLDGLSHEKAQELSALFADAGVKTLVETSRGIPFPDAARAPVRSFSCLALLSVVVALGAAVLLGVGGYVWLSARMETPTPLLERMRQQNRLVIRQISFSKYLIAGTPDGANKYFDKLNIFFVKGTADIQFSLAGIRVDEERTDPVGRTLVLRVPSLLPEVVVRLDPGETYELPPIDPEPLDRDAADFLAKIAGAAAGAAGGYAGGNLGSAVGSSFGFAGKYIGGIAGAVFGGAVAGGGTYLMTKNFLVGKRFANNTLADKDDLVNSGIPLIKMELLGGDMLGRPRWEAEVAAYYKQEFEKSLRDLLGSFGWEKVELMKAG